jgi:hypothetical protein
VQWPKEKVDLKLDGDDPEHIKWLFDKVCLVAASLFGLNTAPLLMPLQVGQ